MYNSTGHVILLLPGPGVARAVGPPPATALSGKAADLHLQQRALAPLGNTRNVTGEVGGGGGGGGREGGNHILSLA